MREASGEGRRAKENAGVDPRPTRQGEVELRGVLDGHVEHFVDVFAFVPDFERLPVVTLAATGIAGYVDIGQEMHLNFNDSITLAGLASTAFDVEAESARHITARARLLRSGEELAQGRKQAAVCGRVGAGSAPDRALADINHPVNTLKARNLLVR